MIKTPIFRENPCKGPNWSFLQIAFAHDSTRVIQCYIQYGTEEQRKQAFEELRGISFMRKINCDYSYKVTFSLEIPKTALENNSY